ncbi:MAG: apolipoprotein N-acyltransferase [Elusimicrobia bacterium]|nr:apolipoprotein N-acyltransferase [Elusimicrobiota bacterium]
MSACSGAKTALLLRLAATASCAAAFAACFAAGGPPWPAWATFAVLLWVIEDQSPARALLYGWLFGGLGWALSVGWFPPIMARFLRVPQPAAYVPFLFVCAYHGSLFALWAGGARWLARRLGGKPGLALACVSVPLMVVLDGFFPQAYPIPLADSQLSHLPALQLLELTGLAGPAWLIMSFNAALYLVLRAPRSGRRWALLASLAAVAAANEAWGRARMAAQVSTGQTIKVGIIQNVIPVERELRPEWFARNLEDLQRLTREFLSSGSADLIVWPYYERILEYDGDGSSARRFRMDGRDARAVLGQDLPFPVPVLVHGQTQSGSGGVLRRFISAYLIGADKAVLGVAEKKHMDPFADTIPLVGSLVPEALYRRRASMVRRLTPGRAFEPLALPGVGKLGTSICYDTLFADSARASAAQGAGLLIQLSSDVWFDDPQAREYLLRFVIPRAIETRRFLIRAVNGGVSAVIDPAGRVVARAAMDLQTSLAADVVMRAEPTLYVRLGDLGYYLGLAALLAAALLARGKR